MKRLASRPDAPAALALVFALSLALFLTVDVILSALRADSEVITGLLLPFSCLIIGSVLPGLYSYKADWRVIEDEVGSALGRFDSATFEPGQLSSCFISYSHADKVFAQQLYSRLANHNVGCWLDEHEMIPGDRILDVVGDAIRLHDKILLCCSETSLNSWWVKDEIRKATERERRDGRDIIIPLMVDRYLLDGWEDGMAADLRSRLAADFTGWEQDNAKFEEQFERVVRALRTDEDAENERSLTGALSDTRVQRARREG